MPSLPPGFIKENLPDNRLLIEKQYEDSEDEYQVMRDILETMEQLYEWALTLPEFQPVEDKPKIIEKLRGILEEVRLTGWEDMPDEIRTAVAQGITAQLSRNW